MFDLETLQPVTNPAPGQRVLVSLFGTVFEAQSLDYIAAELLPAGFEVEQVGLPDSVVQEWSDPGDCPLQEGEDAAEVERGDLIPTTQWLPGVCMIDGEPAFQTTDYDYGEARADRVLFGFFLERGSFALYVMRRAQAGDVVQPGAYVEAMMRPSIHARGSRTTGLAAGETPHRSSASGSARGYRLPWAGCSCSPSRSQTAPCRRR